MSRINNASYKCENYSFHIVAKLFSIIFIISISPHSNCKETKGSLIVLIILYSRIIVNFN